MKNSEKRLKYQAVIFDLDGTLADTIQDLAQATNWGLRQLGFSEYPVDDYKLMVGEGRTELCRRALPENAQHLTDKLARLMTEYYSEHYLDNTKLYPGISDLLCKLSEMGVKLAVLSNKPHKFVELTVNKLCPNIKFSVVRGEHDGLARKPDPAGALAIASELNVSPEDILYVGDTSIDMETANRANMYAVGVTWGFRSREELEEHGADIIVDSPEQIYKLVAC